VAIYGKSPPGMELWGMRSYADLIGFAYSCEQLWDLSEAQADQANEEAKKRGSNEETISFISGECHYHGGPLLWVSQITVDEGIANRLFGGAGAKYGDIMPMLPDAPHAAAITNAIAPIFEFVRKQDKAGLEAHLKKLGNGGASYNANDAIDLRQATFSFLMGAPKTPDVHYFVPNERIRGADGDYAAIGCVCKVEDCDGKWPIAYMDATNRPGWPYSCIQIWKERDLVSVRLY
jgi:hypothetical protein